QGQHHYRPQGQQDQAYGGQNGGEQSYQQGGSSGYDQQQQAYMQQMYANQGPHQQFQSDESSNQAISYEVPAAHGQPQGVSVTADQDGVSMSPANPAPQYQSQSQFAPHMITQNMP